MRNDSLNGKRRCDFYEQPSLRVESNEVKSLGIIHRTLNTNYIYTAVIK